MKQEVFIAMRLTQNVALRSDRSVGEMPRAVVTNTAGMTPSHLAEEPGTVLSTETYGERIKTKNM